MSDTDITSRLISCPNPIPIDSNRFNSEGQTTPAISSDTRKQLINQYGWPSCKCYKGWFELQFKRSTCILSFSLSRRSFMRILNCPGPVLWQLHFVVADDRTSSQPNPICLIQAIRLNWVWIMLQALQGLTHTYTIQISPSQNWNSLHVLISLETGDCSHFAPSRKNWDTPKSCRSLHVEKNLHKDKMDKVASIVSYL